MLLRSNSELMGSMYRISALINLPSIILLYCVCVLLLPLLYELFGEITPVFFGQLLHTYFTCNYILLSQTKQHMQEYIRTRLNETMCTPF